MPKSTQNTTRGRLIIVMTAAYLGLLAADIIVPGYTVRLLVLVLPLAFMALLLDITIPTPWGLAGSDPTDSTSDEGGDDQ